MRKSTYLGSRRGNGWPDPRELEPYFLGASGQRLALETGSDNVGLAAEGADGTEDLPLRAPGGATYRGRRRCGPRPG